MTPLVYVFAGAAVALAAGFVIAALLSLGHARTRSRRADELRLYLLGPPTAANPVLRRSLMQITIGDVIRDDDLEQALTAGLREHADHGTPPPEAPADSS